MTIIGTDISFYQDDPNTPTTVDFKKMISANARFAIIRAGQNLWIDRAFKTHWANAKSAGIPRGSYWFYDSRADPKQQAGLWMDVLGSDFGELPLWCDFEENYSGAYAGPKHWQIFIDQLMTKTQKVGIYTGYYYWIERTNGLSNSELSYFSQFPLWIARYSSLAPLVPPPWNTWLIWQFTSSGDGNSYGVESKGIDLNYFNGDEAEFNKLINKENAMPQYKVTVVWPNGANIKNNPNTGGVALDTYQQGETFLADEIVQDNIYPADPNKKWAKVSQGEIHNGKDNSGKYVAVLYPSSSGDAVRATWTEIVEPPPATLPNISVFVDYGNKTVEINSEMSLNVIYDEVKIRNA